MQGVLLTFLVSSSAFPHEHHIHIVLLGGPFFSAARGCVFPSLPSGLTFWRRVFEWFLVAFSFPWHWGLPFRGGVFAGMVFAVFSVTPRMPSGRAFWGYSSDWLLAMPELDPPNWAHLASSWTSRWPKLVLRWCPQWQHSHNGTPSKANVAGRNPFKILNMYQHHLRPPWAMFRHDRLHLVYKLPANLLNLCKCFSVFEKLDNIVRYKNYFKNVSEHPKTSQPSSPLFLVRTRCCRQWAYTTYSRVFYHICTQIWPRARASAHFSCWKWILFRPNLRTLTEQHALTLSYWPSLRQTQNMQTKGVTVWGQDCCVEAAGTCWNNRLRRGDGVFTYYRVSTLWVASPVGMGGGSTSWDGRPKLMFSNIEIPCFRARAKWIGSTRSHGTTSVLILSKLRLVCNAI